MANSVNKQAREDLTNSMQNIDIEIGGVVLPLLSSSGDELKEVVLKIKKGEVGEILPLYKLKN